MAVKRYVLALSLALVAAVAAGCGSGTGTDQGSAIGNKAASGEQTEVAEEQKVALPEGNPAFIGKVTDIVGNEVTVLKADLPAERPAVAQQTPKQAQGQATKGAATQPRGMAMKFSDEPTTFIIPVGTPIVTVQRGSREGIEADLSEIKQDSIVRVWQTNDAVTFVQVTSQGMQRSSGGSESGTRDGAGAGMGGPPPGGPPPGGGF